MSDAVTRAPGTVVGGYIVGGGQYGQTKELDDGIQKAAQFIVDEFGCNAVIRFNSNRRSGGAYIKDTNEAGMVGNDSIGIYGMLTWADCCGTGPFDMDAVFRFQEHVNAHDPYDTLLFHAYVDLRKLDDPYVYQRSVLYKEESPRYATVEEACAWLKQKAAENDAVREYLARCRDFKAGRIGNAYGKTVYAKLPGKVEARKRFLAGEKVYMYPSQLDIPSSQDFQSFMRCSVKPTLIEREGMKPENGISHFNRLVAVFKDRYCNRYDGRSVAFYVATYTYS